MSVDGGISFLVKRKLLMKSAANLAVLRERKPRVIDVFSNSAKSIVNASIQSLGKDATVKRQVVTSVWTALQVLKLSQGLKCLYKVAVVESSAHILSASELAMQTKATATPSFISKIWSTIVLWAFSSDQRRQDLLIPSSFLFSWITLDLLTVLVVYTAQVRYSNLQRVVSGKRQFVELLIVLSLFSIALFGILNVNFCVTVLTPVLLNVLGMVLFRFKYQVESFDAIGSSHGPIDYSRDSVAPMANPLMRGDYADEYESRNPDVFLKGSANIHMLPFSGAEFLPREKLLCLSSGRPSLELGVKIVGVGPFELYYDVEVGSAVSHRKASFSVGKGKVSKLQSQKGQQKYEKVLLLKSIKAQVPGQYRLVKLFDKALNKDTALQSSVTILDCPSAVFGTFSGRPQSQFLDAVEQKSFEKTVCAGEMVSVPVQVRAGQFPVHLWYRQNTRLAKLILSKPSWNISVAPTGAGRTNLEIVKVMDNLNNTLVYPTDAAPLSSDSVIASRFPDSYTIKALRKPKVTVNTAKCLSTLVPSVWTNNKQQFFLEYYVDSDRPVAVTFQKGDGEQTSLDNVTPGWQKFPIDGPGKYEIVYLQDSVCGQTTVSNQMCQIEGVSPPTISLKNRQLTEPCAGTTGIDIEMVFTGIPPFWVEYSLIQPRGETNVRALRDIGSHRYTLQLRPPEPGMYTIKFLRLGDALYDQGTAIVNQSFSQFEQAIHPKSQAKFVSSARETSLMCIDSTFSAKVELSGLGPWELFYEVTHDNARHTSVVKMDDRVGALPPLKLDKVGKWNIALSSAKDAKGCTFPLADRELTVVVLGQKPTAQFSSDTEKRLVPGHSLPVTVGFTGLPPFQLVYSDGQHIQALSSSKATATIKVEKETTIQLLKVKDKVCETELDESLTVTSYDLPTISIVGEYADQDGIIDLPGACVATPEGKVGFSIEMTGVPLFQVDIAVYESTINYGWSDFQRIGQPLKSILGDPVERQSLDFGQSAGWVEFYRQSKPGRYYFYHFTRISDARFTDGVSLSRNKGTLPVLVRQHTYNQPSARFGELPGSVITRCGLGTHMESHVGSSKLDSDSISIFLSGDPPFSVTAEIEMQHQLPYNQTLHSDTSRAQFPLSTLLETVGAHAVTLKAVRDKNGCVASLSGDPVTQRRVVDVLDTVNVQSLSPTVVCDGSALNFVFQGRPPLTVWATFTPTRQLSSTLKHGDSKDAVDGTGIAKFSISDAEEFSVKGNYATFPTKEPGVFALLRVCNSAGCCRDFDNIVHQVRPLPRAELSSDADGEELVLFEGRDLALRVKLEGEPPFSFNYIRSNVNNGVKSDHEIVVTNINSHDYALRTNLPGRYKLVFVADKHCTFPAPFSQTKRVFDTVFLFKNKTRS